MCTDIMTNDATNVVVLFRLSLLLSINVRSDFMDEISNLIKETYRAQTYATARRNI